MKKYEASLDQNMALIQQQIAGCDSDQDEQVNEDFQKLFAKQNLPKQPTVTTTHKKDDTDLEINQLMQNQEDSLEGNLSGNSIEKESSPYPKESSNLSIEVDEAPQLDSAQPSLQQLVKKVDHLSFDLKQQLQTIQLFRA